MADITSVSAPISGTDKTLTFETGRLAQQSQGAVVGKLGETVVLVTANAAKGVREGIDFFPLTVDVEERAYAAGKIPGSFFRREGRPSDAGILTCRLIDRPLRPSFPDGYRNETQVVVTVLGADQENPHDVLAINAASASLMLSGIPFDGPIGAVRVAYGTDGEWIAHPTYEEGDGSTFELVVAGRELADGDVAIMMVEAGGTEKAWSYYEDGAPKVSEEVIAAGLEASKRWIKESIALQRDLVAKAGAREPLAYTPVLDYGDDVCERVTAVGSSKLDPATRIVIKAERNEAIETATAEIIAELAAEFEGREKEIKEAARSLTKKLVRKRIVEDGLRIDGRGRDRHPPAVSRGRRRADRARLGPLPARRDAGAQRLHARHAADEPAARHDRPRHQQALHAPLQHAAVGERRGRPRGFAQAPRDRPRPARRAGAAARSCRARRSSPTRCASCPRCSRRTARRRWRRSARRSLSLMDAGVPIKAPVAGIAMGLVFAEGKYTTLTDILGAEDAFGDMDFKVAGTADFITALQLDTKIDGIPADVLAAALQQARDARLAILEVMNAAIAEPRPEVNETAPKIISFKIPMDKIGEVIGPKGKVINTIQQETGADIAVDDDGVSRHRDDRLGRRRRRRRGSSPDRADHQPADARRSARSTPARS